MPKYQLELNKANYKEVLRKLLEDSNKKAENNNEVAKKFDELGVLAINDKLKVFIDSTKKYLSEEQANSLATIAGLNQDNIRERILNYWKNVLTNYNTNPNIDYFVNILTNKDQNNYLSLEEIKNLILPRIQDNYKDKISINIVDYIPLDAFKNNFEAYLNMLDNVLTDDNLREISDAVNNAKSIYDYEIGDEVSSPIYNDETNEIIQDLKQSKNLDGKDLSDEEVAEYEDALNYANKLFGTPAVDINSLIAEKTDLDRIIARTNSLNYKDTLSYYGHDPNTVVPANDPEIGSYYRVAENKENEHNLIRNTTELTIENDKKEAIKNILQKMKKLGFDKNGITGEDSENKVYGLRSLFDAGRKYKEAIKSNNPLERKKAAIYAKEVKEADQKIKEVLDLIRKTMPLNKDGSYSIPANVDSIRTDGIPAEYRLDYGAISYLAAFNNIINLISENKWDIDKFVEKPMAHIRELYDKNLRNDINPEIANNGLDGTDLIFNMGKRRFENGNDDLAVSASRALEAMALTSSNEASRKQNYALYKSFMENINVPYIMMQNNREKLALNSNLDKAIINPNLKFNDLGVKYYDAKDLKIIEPKEDNFDDVRYLRQKEENPNDFRKRIDESILKYIKMEAEFVANTKDINAMYLNRNQYISLVQKAATKYLLSRHAENGSPEYMNIKELIIDGNNYVKNLIDSISNNDKEYRVLKEIASNSIKIGNDQYSLKNFDIENKYVPILGGYDTFIQNHRAEIKGASSNFMKDDKASLNQIKNKYNTYLAAKRAYDKEVEKVYGRDYTGEIDNLANKKLMDAYIKQSDLYKELVELKNDNINLVSEQIKNGVVLESYLMDRIIQLENNNFNDIPLFRTEKPFTRDEYIKFRYPNEFDELSNEEKDIIFEQYNAKVKTSEYDFFLRKYFEENNLSSKKDEVIDLLDQVKEYPDVEHDRLEAKFLGMSQAEINKVGIGDYNSNFDSADYLLDKTPTLREFRNNIDSEIIEQLKLYAQNNRDDLPKLEDVIDVAQELTFKYLLLNPSLDSNSPEVKELNRLLMDGKNYIANLLRDTNAVLQSINQQPLDIKLSNMKINESEINNYADGLNVFEKYYKDNIGNKNIPQEARDSENAVNVNLKEKYDNYKAIVTERDNFLKQEFEETQKALEAAQKAVDDAKQELENAINNNAAAEVIQEKANALNNIASTSLKEHTYRYEELKNRRDNHLKQELEGAKKGLEDAQDKAKFKTNDLYRRGLVSNDYVSERMKRIDNNDFTLPSMYEIDYMKQRDEYLRSTHPESYDTLSKDEKDILYNSYKKQCECQRREFLAQKFLIERDFAKRTDRSATAYQEYINDLMKEFQKENPNINLEADDNIIIDNIDVKVEDEKEENIIIEEGTRTFGKWFNNLKKEALKSLGVNDEIAALEFDINKDSPEEWLDANYSKFNILGGELKVVFTAAKYDLNEDDRKEFDNLMKGSKYNNSFFKTKEELEEAQHELFRKSLKANLEEAMDEEREYNEADYSAIDYNFEDLDDDEVEVNNNN